MTKSVPDILKSLFKEGEETVNAWFPDTFPVPFENGWFAPRYYKDFTNVVDPVLA